MTLFGVKATVVPDYEVTPLQDDSISALAFAPTSDLLAVSSWSGEVRLYETGPGKAQPKAAYQHEGPVLSVVWSKDGSKCLSGGTDKAGRLFDLATGTSSQVAAHDAPIKCVKWVDSANLLATGSWDKTIKYWDLRTPQPVATVQLPERCYAMDISGPLLVVATAERHIQLFNLNNPTVAHKTFFSPLKMMTRDVACYPDATGYVISSIEGRVGVQMVDDTQASSNYSFKLNRKEVTETFGKTRVDAWPVNSVSFHPLGTLVTAGGDGVMNIWDLKARTRLKTFPEAGGPIAATALSRTGQYLAFAVSYDWHKGISGNVSQANKVLVHTCTEEEIKPRPKKL